MRVCLHACLVMSNFLQPQGLQPARLLSPWNYTGKNTGMGCHFLLQGMFPTQGSNPCVLCLLHWQADAWCLLSHWGSPNKDSEVKDSFALPWSCNWLWLSRSNSWRCKVFQRAGSTRHPVKAFLGPVPHLRTRCLHLGERTHYHRSHSADEKSGESPGEGGGGWTAAEDQCGDLTMQRQEGPGLTPGHSCGIWGKKRWEDLLISLVRIRGKGGSRCGRMGGYRTHGLLVWPLPGGRRRCWRGRWSKWARENPQAFHWLVRWSSSSHKYKQRWGKGAMRDGQMGHGGTGRTDITLAPSWPCSWFPRAFAPWDGSEGTRRVLSLLWIPEWQPWSILEASASFPSGSPGSQVLVVLPYSFPPADIMQYHIVWRA